MSFMIYSIEIKKDVCQAVPNASLDSKTCLLNVDAVNSKLGWYAVAIQVEDFKDSNSMTAISSIPVQFLISIEESNSTCTIP